MRFALLAAGALAAAVPVAASLAMAPKAKQNAAASQEKPAAMPETAHAFTLTGIDGAALPLTQFKGQVVLLVNTASKCGLTPQYDGLEKLHDAYKAKGFTVLGVPSGDFMGQEFGSNKEIKEFCETRFDISFPMAEKAHVKGDEALPLYKWAKAKLGDSAVPTWNFHKILIGKDGKALQAFSPRTQPDAPEVVSAIEAAIKS
jgi:glutathione peroxidase